jgi:hypothetical protein
MTPINEGRPRWGCADGPIETSFPGGNGLQNKPSQDQTQAENRRPAHLRLVAPAPPPRPRRYLTRISVATPFMPVGRSRAFNLSADDIEALIAAAALMEGRVA